MTRPTPRPRKARIVKRAGYWWVETQGANLMTLHCWPFHQWTTAMAWADMLRRQG